MQHIDIQNLGTVLIENTDKEREKTIVYPVEIKQIQLHFVLKGGLRFSFNENTYFLEAKEDQTLLLFNSQKALPISAELEKDSQWLCLVLSIDGLHALFSEHAKIIPFLNTETQETKFYSQGELSPAMAIVVSQLIENRLHAALKNIYNKGKVYELISLYFNKTEDTDLEQCPYLADDQNIRKIRQAKEIIVAEMNEPPTLEHLAKTIDLPLKRLKEGFKQLYGDSVYGFLFQHKMEFARKLLLSNKYSVGEIGLRVGYSTPSHFIAAFKKKYGTTPKKYLSELQT
ncbi:MAG: AraC family transcriptional regulator [Flavobacteriaceae bacterium]|nr:AraC family transcriptional regulator [Flavobacteriaceae bacterium]OUX39593.1 MAG: AraC family transcriptional regulator [Flavobacteriaceae bacterium TMED265]